MFVYKVCLCVCRVSLTDGTVSNKKAKERAFIGVQCAPCVNLKMSDKVAVVRRDRPEPCS